MSERQIRIKVPLLARVEGEGALELAIDGEQIRELKLQIFEPPRYFEKFLEGRDHHEVIDTVARICGICPVAYQISAVQALEQAFGVEVTPWMAAMRRLFYCGEWLQSHSLHIHLLAAPDFLGFNSAIEMASRYPDEVRRGLQLQSLGNQLIRLFGGRSVHPVGLRVGGFHHAPAMAEAKALLAKLEAALPQAGALVRWCADLNLPDSEDAFTSVALRHPDHYPIESGELLCSDGAQISKEDYAEHFRESHQAHSTALYSHYHGEPYLVGPLARLNLNLDRLPAATAQLLQSLPVRFPSGNMFHSALARALEIHLLMITAIELLRDYRLPDRPYVEPTVRAGVGYGWSEAPRGLLWHRYELDARGRVVSARIVPPTSQNQARIEQDLHRSLQRFGLQRPDEQLRLHAEQVIRNYDPCISCATHFLRLKVARA